MSVFEFLLILSTLFCGLVAGFVFAFGIVVMPGLGKLKDREYLRGFKEMDGIIQNNDPVFISVWLGSIQMLVATTVLGWWELDGTEWGLLVACLVVYALGVQLPTFVFNIPLNNRLQETPLDEVDEMELRELRELFEQRWVRSNTFRTFMAILATTGLLFLGVVS